MNNKTNPQDKALEKFADLMIKKLESFKGNWSKPWMTEGFLNSYPTNLSGREYNGMNTLMLLLHCENEGFKIPVFATFDRVLSLNFVTNKQGKRVQATDKDGNPLPKVSINKGAKSFPVFITIFNVVNNKTKERITNEAYNAMSEDRRKEYTRYPSMNVYHVFNIDQTNIKDARPDLYRKFVKEEPVKVVKDEGFVFQPVDTMIAENSWICPIKPTYGDNAYFSISKNEIVLPEKSQFKDGESFYSNLFHEMAHSTGAENQLNRLKPSAFGSKDYATEELVAELTASLVATRYGMEKHIKDDSCAYLNNWLKSLKEEPTFIKTILMDVKRASAMLIQYIDNIINNNEKDYGQIA